MECHENKFWFHKYSSFPTTITPFIPGLRYYESSYYPDQFINHKKLKIDTDIIQNQNLIIDIARRKVFCLVIWVGSSSKIKLISEQAYVLRNQPFINENAVIGWAATDEIYPCRTGYIRCNFNRNQWFGRYKCLPKPDINFMPPGWGCAQRR